MSGNNPFASIPHLRILIGLYIRLKKFPYTKENVTESQFLKEFKEAIRKDFDITTKSINVAGKLLGEPTGVHKLDGIDVAVLEKITVWVFKNLHLKQILDINEVTFYWHTFKEKIVLPTDLNECNNFHYYNELEIGVAKKEITIKDIKRLELKQKLDEFCENKIEELYFLGTEQVYIAHFYSEAIRSTISGIITFDLEKNFAIYKFFERDGSGTLQPRTIQRTDKPGGYFKFHNTTLYLAFQDEDPDKKNIRIYFALSVLETNIYSLPFIKGIFLSSAHNASSPVSNLVILERTGSYAEALERIFGDDKKLLPEIEFELLSESRILLNPIRINQTQDFITHKIYNIFSKLTGNYIFGFIKKDPLIEKRLVLGVCKVYSNGIIESLYGDNTELVKSRVNNKIYFNDKTLRATTIYTDGLDEVKFDFNLKILEPHKGAKMLGGVYIGIDVDPRAGEIYFIQVNEKFEELMENSNAKIIPVNGYKKERKEIQKIAELLLDNEKTFLAI